MKVKLVAEDEARLDKLIELGTEMLAALKALSLGAVQTTLDAIKADADEIAANTAPEKPVAVGIEIQPGPPSTRSTE